MTPEPSVNADARRLPSTVGLLMSFSHWRFSCRLTPELEEQYGPLFHTAEKRAVLTPEHEEALRYWQAHRERFEMRREMSVSLEERTKHGEWYNRFKRSVRRHGQRSNSFGAAVDRYLDNRDGPAAREIVELGSGRASAALAIVFGPRRKSAISPNRTYR